ncbi:MAG: efflux RND transporter permease subunit [Bdellovibrionales bacterium]
MEKLANFFIKNYKLTIVLTLFLVLMGYQGLNKMNAETFPAVSLATATVITSYDGATAGDIETKITKPIEDEVKSVTGVKDVRSVSKSGLSTITIRVDMDNYDVDIVMDDLQKAVQRVNNLPPDLREQPKFSEINSEEFPVFQVAITGDNSKRIRDFIVDELQQDLEDIDQIKSVGLSGHAKRQFKIQLDEKKLRQYHIGVTEVFSKIGSRNVNIPGGKLKSGIDEQLLRVEGKIKDKKDLENFLIRSNFSGQKIYLKDVATVLDSKEDIRIITRYNGEPATLVTIVKKGGSDTIALVEQVNERLVKFEERYGDYKFETTVFNDESEKVGAKLEVLASNAVTGLVLVIVFLFLFLPGRIGIAASLSLPIAVMATVGVMPAFGMNLDSISILALIISIGMLVDNSVVISENYSRLRVLGEDSKTAARNSIKQLWAPITATAFTTIAAFLPMLVTKGIMGKFIMVIPIIVTASLLFSLVESFFLLPMRLTTIAKDVKINFEKESSGFFAKIKSKFEKFVEISVKYRYVTMLGFFTIIGVSILFMSKFNKFILFPPEQTRVYLVRFQAPTGSTVENTDRLAGMLSKAILERMSNRFSHITAKSGEKGVGFNDPKGGDGANLGILTLFANKDTEMNVPHTEVLKELRAIEAPYLVSVSAEAEINGPPVGSAIEGIFGSNNAENLEKMIRAVKADLAQLDGVRDLKTDDVIGEDEIFVNINYAQADRVGLSVNEIGETIRTAISGKKASEVTLNNKEVDLNLRFSTDYRKNVEDLKGLKILNSTGDLIPLSTLASFDRQAGTPQIKRFKYKRARTLLGDVDDTKITSVAANTAMIESYEKHSKTISGVNLYLAGAQESTNESMESLGSAMNLALIGIFALLVLMFNSFLKPLLVMSTIPLGLFGFSIAFSLHGRPISFMAMIGIVGLSGIIINSAIVLMTYIDDLKAEGKLNIKQVLVQASGTRLRAVLVTSLTTMSGLFPTAYGIGGSDAMLIPMTLAMAWGLTSGTIMTLIWLPSAYGILEDITALNKRIIAKLSSKKNVQ